MNQENTGNSFRKNKSQGVSIFGVLKPYKGIVFILVFFALLSNAVNLVVPKIISKGIDTYTYGNLSYERIVIQFLAAALLILIFTFFQSLLQTYASERVAKDLRTKLSDKISRQSYFFIQQVNPSKLLTNLTSDVDSVKLFVSMAVVSVASSVFVIIGASALLISINWKLGLCILLIIPMISFTFMYVFRRLRFFFKRSREIVDWLNRIINESIIGAMLIRVLNAQIPEYNKFLEANTEARDNGMAILKLFATLIPIVTFVSNFASLTILLLGGHFVIIGDMSLGDFTAFNSYLSLLIFPIMLIGFMSNFIAQSSASYGRIMEVVNAPETIDAGTIDKSLAGYIEMRNVSLNFNQKPILKNISFQIKPGTKTAIIGPTAAGKTQLLYLLIGLIKPDNGEILFDNINLENYIKETFQRQLGFVFQDSVIFSLSLRENIAFNENVTEEAMNKAIKTSELVDFIQTLPDGLETVVSERGTSLSGGQKQRIMLARALAQNPKILLLDDFTARVDNQTEQKILQNVERNYPDLTLLSITQKIASVEHYEQILLLEEGEILAIGSHEELIKKSPEYIQIFNSQRSTNFYEERL